MLRSSFAYATTCGAATTTTTTTTKPAATTATTKSATASAATTKVAIRPNVRISHGRGSLLSLFWIFVTVHAPRVC